MAEHPSPEEQLQALVDFVVDVLAERIKQNLLSDQQLLNQLADKISPRVQSRLGKEGSSPSEGFDLSGIRKLGGGNLTWLQAEALRTWYLAEWGLSNRLAHVLVNCGIRPEEVLGAEDFELLNVRNLGRIYLEEIKAKRRPIEDKPES